MILSYVNALHVGRFLLVLALVFLFLNSNARVRGLQRIAVYVPQLLEWFPVTCNFVRL